jgi:hypothetical protein
LIFCTKAKDIGVRKSRHEFIEELEDDKTMEQHGKCRNPTLAKCRGVDERILKYKLEAYQKNFLDFICGSLISIEVLGQEEKIQAKTQWNIKRMKYKLKNHRTSKVE